MKLYNLTNSQNNILLREEYYKGTSINNISFTYCINKKLNVDTCIKVINKIIEVSDGLRIQLKHNGNKTVQYVKKFKEQKIQIIDYSNKKMEAAKIEMEEDAKIPFVFEDSKLYVFKIYKLPINKTGIYIKLHHIIADAWVTKILLKQFNEFYKMFSEGKEITEEKFSYIDFINNENKYFESEAYQKDKIYWEEYIKDIPEAIQFKDISISRDSKAERFSKYISEKLSKNIDTFCKENKITQYNFFMTIYAIYLYKTLGKTEFTIGTPLLNRKDFSEKQTVGMFVSTIPMKIRIDENETIEPLAKRIGIDIRNALRHQKYPYEKMLEFARENNKNSNNLFDTILSFQNIKPDKKYIDYEFNHFWNFAANQQSSFEIHISDYNDEGKYLLNLDFKSGVVEEKEKLLIYERLICIIENAIENKEKRIKEIQYIPDKEMLDLRYKFNNKNIYTPDETLVELFEKQVKKNPNNVALKFKNKKLTYKELDEKVNVLANYFTSIGIKEEPITLLLNRSLEMVISMLAVLKVGAYYIPIDPNWPMDRVKYIVEDSNSKYVITHEQYITQELNIQYVDVDKILEEKNKSVNIKDKSKIEGYSYIIYTSGSTGKPKGTLMTHKNVVGLLNSTHRLFKQTEKDRWTLFHTYTFDFSSWEIYGSLLYGGTLIIVPKETTTNPKEFLNLLIKEKITILNQTPAYFYKVIEQEKISNIDEKQIRIRLVILGGEAVHAEPLKYWKNKYPNIIVYNGYGPTETTIFAIMCEITQKDIEENNIYIGYPLNNYNIQILDKNLNIMPVGCIGEICISGIGVCEGYLKNKELTKEKFINHPYLNTTIYKSGDVGYFSTDGRIKYVGRNDNQVKIRGFRIEIEEIEKEILNCGDITKVVVMPMENDNYTKSLIGFIETEKENYTEVVIEKIKKHLTSYMIPRLYQVKEFPLNDNGKIDRKLLLSGIVETKKEIIEPQGDLQKEILKMISKIAKNKDISIKDDFFTDLTLDSLDIMQIATMMNKYDITIQDINDNSTIENLSKKIEEKDLKKEENKIQDVEIINKKVEYDLSKILLTGTTGFLGIHILRELIKNPSTEKIYCLIREKNNELPEKRINKAIKDYFTKEDMENVNKIKLVSGDFEKEDLGLDKKDLLEIKKNVRTIIHSGANVRHYGKYNKFYKTNVEGTKNVINLAQKCNAKVSHISTLSVGGFSKIEDTNILNENSINIEQEFKQHVYMITKYEAECEILKAIKNKEIEANIFRLGNIMPRLSDGKFQTNNLENGFMSRIATVLKTRAITKVHKNLKIDLSPVDLCAQAILKIMKQNNKQTIYHIYNNNLISIEDLIKEENVKEVSIEEQIKLIENLNEPLNAHLLNDLMNNDYMETKASNNITIDNLNNVGFNWNKIDKNYLSKIFEIIKGEINEKY
ncbi:MAG: amino acid adenylation domain-containing protein [Clostridia bacterium]|nr:amino acid adenylation domain-containing protein [Clostridia bacterium]